MLARVRHPAILLALAAVGVHAGVLGAVYLRAGSVTAYAFASLDAEEYYRLAANLAEHGRFSLADEPPRTPDTWRTPGYPLFLAAAMLVGGMHPAWLIAVQQVLSVASVLLLYAIALRLTTPRRAVIAAALLLFEPYHLFYSTWLLATAWFLALLLLTWYAWLVALERRRWTSWIAVGGLAGLLVLTRPVAVLVPFALLVGTVANVFLEKRRSAARSTPRGAWAPAVCFVVSAGIVIGAWMTRNHLVAERFALSSQGGVVLAYFKATECVLWREGRAGDRYLETSLHPAQVLYSHRVWEGIDAELRAMFADESPERRAQLTWPNLAQGNRTDLDSFAISRCLGAIGRRHLLQDAVSTLACCTVRCGSILTFPLNLALRPPAHVPTSRVRSALLGTVYLVAVCGVLFRLITRRFAYREAFFPLACLAALLVATTPQCDPRFRVPMIPLLVVLLVMSGRPRRSSSTPPDPVSADQNAMSNEVN